MKRYERTRVLAEGDPILLHDLVQHIESDHSCGEIVVLDDPREELVMVQARETARGGLFYLGEALMTSCRVARGDTVGYGFALGSDRCRAYQLAVVDAAFSGVQGDALNERWNERLLQEAAAVRAREAEDAARVAATRVDFSTMKVDA